MRKPRVLWVEDSARFELANLLGPIYASHKYELTLAEDATSAVRYLMTAEFDAIIMDIRLPPGRDRHWSFQYERAGSDKAIAQLGLALLEWLLGRANGKYGIARPPAWVRPQQFAVFSVEGEMEIGQPLEAMGVRVFVEKRPGLRDTVLLEIIERILSQSNGRQVNTGETR